MPTLHVFPTTREVADYVALRVVAASAEAVENRARFTIALAGGSTPRLLYEVLAEKYADKIPWRDVCIFWGDERMVPLTHPDSNFRMAYDTLISRVPIPAANLYPMPTGGRADHGAIQYENVLKQFYGDSPQTSFDFLLLGMGSDGHTASLFPDSEALNERERWVTSYHVDHDKGWRMTLTPPILNLARQVVIMVTGASKAERLADVLQGETEPHLLPIQTIAPVHGNIAWAVDEAAASYLG